jgi:hypothetical protein
LADHLYLGKKNYAGTRSTRSNLRLMLPALLVLTPLVSFQCAGANLPVVSGQTQIGNTLVYGTTSYTVYYSYPSVAQVGRTLNVSLSLHVNQFGGVVEYTTQYSLEAHLFVGTNVLQSTVQGPPGFNETSFLYPGGTWGPNNFTFPLTESNTGLASGESTNATLSVTLSDTVFYGFPYNLYRTEPSMTGSVGSILVQGGGATSTSTASAPGSGGRIAFVPYALVGAGAVLMAAAFLLPIRSRSHEKA